MINDEVVAGLIARRAELETEAQRIATELTQIKEAEERLANGQQRVGGAMFLLDEQIATAKAINALCHMTYPTNEKR